MHLFQRKGAKTQRRKEKISAEGGHCAPSRLRAFALGKNSGEA
ncbi:MAG: hypothetical protein BMS9Abin37_2146 [Acidobacteriota bacterium]|nr:MAG: hypothetical protein BMS9Abin37_2146 [Acidobacteriota bacterium]